jgi:hypothetical protein
MSGFDYRVGKHETFSRTIDAFLASAGFAVEHQGVEQFRKAMHPLDDAWPYCPKCNSHDTTGFIVTYDDGSANIKNHCNDCTWQWFDAKGPPAPRLVPVKGMPGFVINQEKCVIEPAPKERDDTRYGPGQHDDEIVNPLKKLHDKIVPKQGELKNWRTCKRRFNDDDLECKGCPEFSECYKMHG